MKIVCAWCGKTTGEKEPLEDKSVTHGICEKCLIKNFPHIAEKVAEVEKQEGGNPDAKEPWQRAEIEAVSKKYLSDMEALGPHGSGLEKQALTDKYTAKIKALKQQPQTMKEGNPDAKEPWQMTREEYVKSAREWRAENMPRLTGRALEDELEHVAAGHKLIVLNAMGLGKPVPPEVLADYPELRTREGNPGMTPDKWLLKVSIERAPLRVAKQLGYEVHRLSPTDIVDKADYASGFRFRLSKAVPNQPYPQIVMARSEGEVATFLKRQTEAGNPPYLVCQTIELCHRIDAPSKEQAIGLARDKGETDAITELLKDWHVKRKGGNPLDEEEIDRIATLVTDKVLAEAKEKLK